MNTISKIKILLFTFTSTLKTSIMKKPDHLTQYELVKNIYNQNIDKINKLTNESKFTLSFQVLQNFIVKINDIQKGLESIHESKSFYASQALARISSEHFLIAFYIFTKTRIEESDECASDYLYNYAVYEMIKRKNYNAKLEKTYDPKKTPLENFLVSTPEFSNKIEEADLLDINKKANQFDVRHILKYIQNELDPNDAFKN